MVPVTFEQWKRCITEECGTELTAVFAKERLRIYKDSAHPETRKFLELYGKEHLQNIIKWFALI